MTEASDLFSRRQVMGGLGVGWPPRRYAQPLRNLHFINQPSSHGSTMQDPLNKYPKPPFKRQSQPWPGLASKMDPKPDHGETSYKGSGRLAGRKALITGGDSGMGRAAAIAYAREGADVAINYYPDEEPDAQEVIKLIKDAGRNGVALPGDLRDAAFCTKLVNDAVEKLGGLDILVNNAGPPAGARFHSRYYRRTVRLDDEDQHLRAVLDHQGGASASEAGRGHYRHDVRASLRSFTGFV